MPAGDEPLLKGEAPVRSVEPGAERVVACREDGRLDTERGGEPHAHDGQRLSLSPGLCANEMQTEVMVAETEPRLTTQGFDGLECVPRFLGSPPPSLLVGQTGQGVEHAVEIGRNR